MYLCPKFLNFGVLFFKHKITNFRELLLYYRNKFKQLHKEGTLYDKPLSELFSRKTSIFVNDTKEFNSYNSNEVNTKKAQKQGFDSFYHKLIDKVNQLEKLFLENKIEKTENNTYFLPNKLLL